MNACAHFVHPGHLILSALNWSQPVVLFEDVLPLIWVRLHQFMQQRLLTTALGFSRPWVKVLLYKGLLYKDLHESWIKSTFDNHICRYASKNHMNTHWGMVQLLNCQIRWIWIWLFRCLSQKCSTDAIILLFIINAPSVIYLNVIVLYSMIPEDNSGGDWSFYWFLF